VTRLPAALEYEDIATVGAMYDAIKKLKVRGAPLIGIAAAYGLYCAVMGVPDTASAAETTTRQPATATTPARPWLRPYDSEFARAWRSATPTGKKIKKKKRPKLSLSPP
jgi:methylthioribose-1-phosphate isomerase